MKIDSPHKTTNSSFFNIMSKNYAMGKTSEAQNIQCNIKPLHNKKLTDNLTITVYEFSPLASFNDYCLLIRNNNRSTICSGSKEVNEVLGPFESSDGWQIKMELSSSATYIPDIRFWILFHGM